MRIVYIISAYKLPDQLIRLVDRLNASNVFFLIHIDKKTDDQIRLNILKRLNSYPNVTFLKSHTCYWASFDHVKITLKAIKKIVKGKMDFDYAVLITGQDYPIKSNHEIEKELQSLNGYNAMSFWPIEGMREPGPGRGWPARIKYFHFHWRGNFFMYPFPRQFKWPALTFIWSVLFHLFPIKPTFPKGFTAYGGMSYWNLSKEGVLYIYDFVTRNRCFVNFFKRVLIPDELFFQTILLNSPLREKIINEDYRFIDWVGCKGNPRILTTDDYGKLMVSNKLFARKFDISVDAKILDMIDRKICS